MAAVTRFIERKLRLLVNAGKISFNGPYDLTFLGFRFGNIGNEAPASESIRLPRTFGSRSDW